MGIDDQLRAALSAAERFIMHEGLWDEYHDSGARIIPGIWGSEPTRTIDPRPADLAKFIFEPMAKELERLLDEFLSGLGMEVGSSKELAAEELKQFLWDNKVGILRALQAVAKSAGTRKSKASRRD